MIVVDTSALMAILLGETEAKAFFRLIVEARPCRIAAPTHLEFLMVASGQRSADAVTEPQALLKRLSLEIVAWEPAHAEIAFEAFLRFGKGRHPAKLNFGDCMSYALAKSLGVPLLFKGEDFAKTDIASAE